LSPKSFKGLEAFYENQHFNSRHEPQEFGSQPDITAHNKTSQNCLSKRST